MSEQKDGLAQGASMQPLAWVVDGPMPLDSSEVFLTHEKALEAFNEWGKRITPLFAIPDAMATLTPAGCGSVAWIAFADNGNVRLWTADEQRAKDEKARGLDMRAFTLAELIALVSRLGQAEAQVESARAKAIEECAALMQRWSDEAGEFKDSTRCELQMNVCSNAATAIRNILKHPSTERQDG